MHLDAHRSRSVITDQQHQAAILFRWAYLTASRHINVSEPDWTRVDGGVAGWDATAGNKPEARSAPVWVRRALQNVVLI